MNNNEKMAKLLIKLDKQLSGNSDSQRVTEWIRYIKKEDLRRETVVSLNEYKAINKGK